MNNTAGIHPDADLFAVLTHAEGEAERVLGDGTPPLDAIVWLSAHLAAFERVVSPALKRVKPDGAALRRRQREIADRMSRLLRMAERHHSGDALAAGLNADRLAAALRTLIDEHVAVESTIVERLTTSIDAAESEQLIAAYEAALRHAPTRPHPHLPRGAMTFRIDALRDRVLDAMDGRHVPVPRIPRRKFVPGRWGSYFLAQLQPPPEAPSDDVT